MRIQRLELFGFKSFPDRTGFEFGTGISVVVGPNGSGKSNVVDALRWVIGEQSARSLRGKDMADVIFAGSAVRAPVGFAEVSLTLSAAEGEPFPGDLARFEEVEIGRRLYRDGTSEYLLNRVKCRRRDIVDLFMDTGVGSNLYSFIAQGQVDRIVSQSPHDRRSLIDEAAGISRYKLRRDEALTRLTATATQLDRASDVADEMGRRLRALEKQVVQAGRFRRTRAQVRQLETALGVVKYAALSGDRRALRERLRTVQQDTGALQRSVSRVEQELQVRQAELDTVAEAVSTWRDQAAELEAQRREAEGARVLQQKRHQEWVETIDRLERRAAEIQQRETEAVEEGTRLEQALGVLVHQLEGLEDLAQPVAKAAEQVNTVAAKVARLGEASARLEAERAGIEEQLSQLRQVQVPVPLQLLPIDRRALDALLAESEQVEVRVLEATERVTVERASANEARAAIEKARGLHREALQTWERQRSDRERQRQQRERWLRRCTSNLETQRRAAYQRREQQLEARARTWIDAIRRHADEGEGRIQEVAQAARQLRSAPSWGVDGDAWTSAEDASRRAQLALQTARSQLADAEEALASARGQRLALEAEFEALDRRRREALPDAWADRETLHATLDDQDPRRITRSELLGLPVLRPEDLSTERGRGIWPVANRWRLVDNLAEAHRVLAEHGPPVATQDGRLRVDADGLVELGEPTSRWGPVQQELAAAREQEAMLLQRVAAEREQVAALVQAAEHAGEVLQQAEQHFIGRVGEEQARRRDLLRVQVQTWQEQAEAGRIEARRQLQPGLGGEGLLARAWSRSQPPALSPRPQWSEPELDTAAVAVAERVLDELRAQQRRIEGQDKQLRRGIADEERRRAVVEARFEAEVQAAEEATRNASVLEQRLASLTEVEGRSEAEQALQHAKGRHQELVCRQEALRVQAVGLRETRARLLAEKQGSERAVQRAQLDQATTSEECIQAREQAETALEAVETNRTQATALAVQRGEVIERLERDKGRLSKLKEQAKALRVTLSTNREGHTRHELEGKDLAQRVEQLQIDIETLRKSLGDRYQVSLPGLLDRLQLRRSLTLEAEASAAEPLEVGDVRLEGVEPLQFNVALLDDEDRVVAMVAEVERLRTSLARIGDVNLAAEEEYVDLHTRYADLDAQRADLEASVLTIRAAIAKMNRTCRTRFRDAYDRINEAFQIAYPKLVGGGDARLALTNDEDLLETGVDIFVRPPGKRLQNLTLLSGGEKAMTAIALLLALFKVRPSPFCVLDEVDAPLDEANGARFNEMVKEMATQSQFILITHNRKTMECADVLYGVTMADPGVSKLVSVALS